MNKNLYNRGYMLIEIILASVLAMIVAYFVIELTIKLKNNNDDLLVRTLVSTEQAIIYNTIMKDIKSSDDISCDYLFNKITIDKEKNIFTYGDYTNVISEYATFGNVECSDNGGTFVWLDIPINVKQLPNDEFSITIREELTELPEKQITLVGCRDTSDAAIGQKYFVNGSSSSLALVGKMPSTGNRYVVKYPFKSSFRANSVKVLIRPARMFWDEYANTYGSDDHFRFYIGTDGNSHKNANGNSQYTGTLESSSASGDSGYSDISASTKLVGVGDVEIQPNVQYYLWVFSDGSNSGVFWFDSGVYNGFVDIVLNPKVNSTIDVGRCD